MDLRYSVADGVKRPQKGMPNSVFYFFTYLRIFRLKNPSSYARTIEKILKTVHKFVLELTTWMLLNNVISISPPQAEKFDVFGTFLDGFPLIFLPK